jgi:hypothetical protein
VLHATSFENALAYDRGSPSLEKVVGAVRKRCKRARIVVRGDSGFCREDILRWCEDQGVYYCIGFARNDKLVGMIERERKEALTLKAQAQGRCGSTATSGIMENVLKQALLDMAADRTSTALYGQQSIATVAEYAGVFAVGTIAHAHVEWHRTGASHGGDHSFKAFESGGGGEHQCPSSACATEFGLAMAAPLGRLRTASGRAALVIPLAGRTTTRRQTVGNQSWRQRDSLKKALGSSIFGS